MVVLKDLKTELNIPAEEKMIFYQGVIALNKEIEVMVKSLKYLPDVFMLMLFGYAFDEYRNRLQEFIEKQDLEGRVVFYGKFLSQELLGTISQCYISTALYGRNKINNCLHDLLLKFLVI